MEPKYFVVKISFDSNNCIIAEEMIDFIKDQNVIVNAEASQTARRGDFHGDSSREKIIDEAKNTDRGSYRKLPTIAKANPTIAPTNLITQIDYVQEWKELSPYYRQSCLDLILEKVPNKDGVRFLVEIGKII